MGSIYPYHRSIPSLSVVSLGVPVPRRSLPGAPHPSVANSMSLLWPLPVFRQSIRLASFIFPDTAMSFLSINALGLPPRPRLPTNILHRHRIRIRLPLVFLPSLLFPVPSRIFGYYSVPDCLAVPSRLKPSPPTRSRSIQRLLPVFGRSYPTPRATCFLSSLTLAAPTP